MPVSSWIAGRQLLAARLGAPYDAILVPVIAALQEELAALRAPAGRNPPAG